MSKVFCIGGIYIPPRFFYLALILLIPCPHSARWNFYRSIKKNARDNANFLTPPLVDSAAHLLFPPTFFSRDTAKTTERRRRRAHLHNFNSPRHAARGFLLRFLIYFAARAVYRISSRVKLRRYIAFACRPFLCAVLALIWGYTQLCFHLHAHTNTDTNSSI